MTEQELITAPYNTQTQEVNQIYGTQIGKLLALQQMSFGVSTGSIQIPKEAINECVENHINDIIKTQIITFDVILTTSGYILSLLVIAFALITSSGILLFIGVFGFIPLIVHSVDGITRRWQKIKITKNQV